MVHYRSFLGCMTTKSGVKLISISTIAGFVLYLAALGLYGSLYGLATTVDTPKESNGTETISDENHPDPETNEGISNAGIVYCIQGMSTYYMGMVISDSDMSILVIISLIVCIVGITLNGMLLFGSENKRRFFMLPWLIMTMMHLLVCSMFTYDNNLFKIKYSFQLDLLCRLYVLIQTFPWLFAPAGKLAEYQKYWLDTLFPGVPILIFGFYFWDVVNSVYRDIKNEDINATNHDNQEMKTQEQQA